MPWGNSVTGFRGRFAMGKGLAIGCGKKKGNKPEVILDGRFLLLNGQFEFTTNMIRNSLVLK